jgi:hypothetical protein
MKTLCLICSAVTFFAPIAFAAQAAGNPENCSFEAGKAATASQASRQVLQLNQTMFSAAGPAINLTVPTPSKIEKKSSSVNSAGSKDYVFDVALGTGTPLPEFTVVVRDNGGPNGCKVIAVDSDSSH